MSDEMNQSKETGGKFPWAMLVVMALVGTNIGTFLAWRERGPAEGATTEQVSETSKGKVKDDSTPLMDIRVINGHEHMYKIEHFKKYLPGANKVGIDKTLVVASSAATLLGKEDGLGELNEWNSQEVLKAAKEFPGKIIPFCTIYSKDPDKLEKLKGYVAEGAQGVKLYTGHTQFYDEPLDAPAMDEVYAYCEEVQLPILWHVSVPKYVDEFRRVLDKYPRLKVIVPHLGVGFFRPRKELPLMAELLDDYPNLYFDSSFGTRAILVHGLEVVGQNVKVFRDFCIKHQDRIIFGTDMVITGNSEKTAEWFEACIRACRDMFEKDQYHFFMGATGSAYAHEPSKNTYGEYAGLALPSAVMKKIYADNLEKVLKKDGTK